MNRLCRYVESEFDGYLHSVKVKDYPYRDLLASGNFDSARFKKADMDQIKALYSRFKELMKSISIMAGFERHDNGELITMKLSLYEQFRRDCLELCSSEEKLCNILLKICYSNDNSKRFVWSLFGDRIVKNLLERRKEYSYFVRSDSGTVLYGGEKYEKVTMEVED